MEKIIPLMELGAGYLDTRNYSGVLLQVEYKSGFYLWRQLRPQTTLVVSKYGSGYIGVGLSWEYYLTKQLIIIPSFTPGLYWRANGKRLGYPLEFRSCIEICYEKKNKGRIGVQLYHVSNAHLSHTNPGFNAFMLCLSFPLRKL